MATSAARGSTGDVPFNVFARAISAARVNLNITRRSHATVPGSSTCRPFELASAGAAIVSNPYAGIERWFEPGSELLVVDDAAEAADAYRSLLDDPGEAEAMGGRARERVLDEHTYAHRARRSLSCSGSTSLPTRVPEPRRIAIVPARDEAGAIGAVLDELRAFDPAIDVVVVDDGSGDARPPRRAHGAAVVRLPFNLGIGGAVQTGFKFALENGYDDARAARRRRPARPAASCPQLLAPAARRRGRHRRRLALRRRRRRLPAAVRAPRRHPLFAGIVSLLAGQQRHGHDLRLPGAQRGAPSRSSPPTTRTTTPRSRRP